MADPADTRGGSLRPGTRDPHRSRERALKVLFQADLRGQDPRDTLAAIVDDPDAQALLDDEDVEDAAFAGRPHDVDEYARRLVQGVGDHRADIDRLIERFARRWTIPRMPVIDRNVLRLGAYELLHEDTSPAVVIDEALELAKGMSTDNSARFVNGILESVRRWHVAHPEGEGQDVGAEDAPADDAPADDAPADDAPADDPPADEAPADEASRDSAPSED